MIAARYFDLAIDLNLGLGGHQYWIPVAVLWMAALCGLALWTITWEGSLHYRYFVLALRFLMDTYGEIVGNRQDTLTTIAKSSIPRGRNTTGICRSVLWTWTPTPWDPYTLGLLVIWLLGSHGHLMDSESLWRLLRIPVDPRTRRPEALRYPSTCVSRMRGAYIGAIHSTGPMIRLWPLLRGASPPPHVWGAPPPPGGVFLPSGRGGAPPTPNRWAPPPWAVLPTRSAILSQGGSALHTGGSAPPHSPHLCFGGSDVVGGLRPPHTAYGRGGGAHGRLLLSGFVGDSGYRGVLGRGGVGSYTGGVCSPLGGAYGGEGSFFCRGEGGGSTPYTAEALRALLRSLPLRKGRVRGYIGGIGCGIGGFVVSGAIEGSSRLGLCGL
ncbi:hypothetical protein G9A89_000187 [Geosiphon pyriformis]|nr:hypothetical protein G9A89_000187 [Geosiphon pyriformis]